MRRVGVLTGGGDAPGLNAVIRAVVRTAEYLGGWQVIGIHDGFDGLWAEGGTEVLDSSRTQGLLPRGGTILGAANRGNPFVRREVRGGQEVVVDVTQKVLEGVERLGLEAIVVVGGDGTLRFAEELGRRGCQLVCVPKTIDNDLGGTDVTFGFDTALTTATEAIDKLHTTAESHHRVMVVELMGREAGWIALGSGIAGGADAILIPEIPFTFGPVCRKIEARARSGRSFSIVAVAEGAHELGREQVLREAGDELKVARLGGIGKQVADEIARRTGVETRVTVLGHLQRGGSPSPFDRWLATRYGAAAMRLVASGRFGRMVSFHGRTIRDVPLDEALAATPRLVPTGGELVETARCLGVVFGDEGC